jgi:hypothetical protein
MRRGWGDQITAIAISQIYNIRIKIHFIFPTTQRKQGEEIIPGDFWEHNSTTYGERNINLPLIHIILMSNENHYYALLEPGSSRNNNHAITKDDERRLYTAIDTNVRADKRTINDSRNENSSTHAQSCDCVHIHGQGRSLCFDSNYCANAMECKMCTSNNCKPQCFNQANKFKKYPVSVRKMNITNKDTGKTVAKQHGLFAESIITEGHPVLEYTGIIYTHAKFNKEAKKDATLNHYVVEYDNGNYMLTARQSGSKARFVNHSCEPNTYLAEYICNGQPKIMIVSKRRINCNEELTFDYRWKEKESQIRNKCYCGANTCRGYLQAKEKRKASAMENWLENHNSTTTRQLNLTESEEVKASTTVTEVQTYEVEQSHDHRQIPRETGLKRNLLSVELTDNYEEETQPTKTRKIDISADTKRKFAMEESNEEITQPLAKRAHHNPHNDNKPP